MIFKLRELFYRPGGIAKGALTARIENPKFGRAQTRERR